MISNYHLQSHLHHQNIPLHLYLSSPLHLITFMMHCRQIVIPATIGRRRSAIAAVGIWCDSDYQIAISDLKWRNPKPYI
ncbi:hypothetical protein Hanom_Chr14g01319821 [Helianthus anomalus]